MHVPSWKGQDRFDSPDNLAQILRFSVLKELWTENCVCTVLLQHLQKCWYRVRHAVIVPEDLIAIGCPQVLPNFRRVHTAGIHEPLRIVVECDLQCFNNQG
jgi:hypothetical protein